MATKAQLEQQVEQLTKVKKGLSNLIVKNPQVLDMLQRCLVDIKDIEDKAAVQEWLVIARKAIMLDRFIANQKQNENS